MNFLSLLFIEFIHSDEAEEAEWDALVQSPESQRFLEKMVREVKEEKARGDCCLSPAMMKSEVTRRFRKLYELLPIGTLLGTPVYSVRIGRKWRALGSLEGNTVEWFWIGSHEAYNHVIARPDPSIVLNSCQE